VTSTLHRTEITFVETVVAAGGEAAGCFCDIHVEYPSDVYIHSFWLLRISRGGDGDTVPAKLCHMN
jgi:hypothetical protein